MSVYLFASVRSTHYTVPRTVRYFSRCHDLKYDSYGSKAPPCMLQYCPSIHRHQICYIPPDDRLCPLRTTLQPASRCSGRFSLSAPAQQWRTYRPSPFSRFTLPAAPHAAVFASPGLSTCLTMAEPYVSWRGNRSGRLFPSSTRTTL